MKLNIQTKLFITVFILLMVGAISTFIAVSELNTLNAELLKIAVQNPDLQHSLKSNASSLLFGLQGLSWLLGIVFVFWIINTLAYHLKTVSNHANLILKGDLQTLQQEMQAKTDNENNEFSSITLAHSGIASVLLSLSQNIEIIAQASCDGKLQQRLPESKYQGDWQQIAHSVNVLLNEAVLPINAQLSALQQMAEGQLTTRIVENFNGDHNRTKDAVNRIADIASDVMREVAALTVDFESGNYASRANEELYFGDWRTILTGVNNILSIVNSTTQEIQTQNWIKTGLSELSGRIRGDMSLSDLAYQVASYTAVYTNAQIGALYLWNEDDQHLHLTGSYAYEFRKNSSQKFALGESLVGQAALEKQLISVTDLPDDYVRISSAIGSVRARNTVVVPILYEGKIKGVLELGSLQEFTKETLDLLRLYSDTIGMAVMVVESSMTTRFLLKQSQEQTERLQSQQEELQQYNEELEEQTQSLKISEFALKQQQEELQQTNEELEEQTQALQSSEMNLKLQQEELQQTNEELEEQTQALRNSELELKLQQEELQQTNEELEERTEALEQQRDQIEQKNKMLNETQKDLARRAEELAIASKYKSEFLANMSHELRTPLNSMLLLSHSLSDNRDGNLSDKQVESARVMYESGKDLLGIINDILDLSKIESGHEQAVMEWVTLEDVIAQTDALYRPVAEDKNLEFIVKIESCVPKQLHTDAQRLGQILRNLLSNAFKFTQNGSVSLIIDEPAANEKFNNNVLSVENTLAFSVIDTGVGIPEDKQISIWEAFQQADGSTSRQYGGTGLGLTISRELARLLGGEIHIQSTVNVGSTFTVFLPIDTAQIHFEQAITNKVFVKEKKKGRFKKETTVHHIPDDRETLADDDSVILIVEDDPVFAQILADLCHEHNHKYLAAPTAEEALNLISIYSVSGIFLDMILPEKDGWTVLSHIKNNLEKAHIPIYVMSADEIYSDVKLHGASDFLTKPITEDKLQKAFASIDEILRDKSKKILIVGNDLKLARSITELLGEEKTNIVNTEQGSIALEKIKNEFFDLVILDFNLPDMNAIELLKRANEENTKTLPPVIIYTGRDLTRKEYESTQRYASSVIVKSVQSDERLLTEAQLFLHRKVSSLPERSKKMLLSLHDKDAMFQGKKVLLVDDDIRNIFSLSAILEERGMSVITACNGQEALDQLRLVQTHGGGIDLLITDVMMPGMDGLELIKLIRSEDRYLSLPIIALTAKAMKEDRTHCLDAGASDYLTKPVDVERLLSMLHVWLYR